MQTCNVYSIFQEYIWHFANIGSAKGRLREVVKCVLFTFTMPTGVRSERANPCFFVLFCFAWVIIWQGLYILGIFIRNVMLLFRGTSGPCFLL